MVERPITLALRLENALSGWMLPTVLLGVAAAFGALYLFGWVGEEVTAAALVLSVASGAALALVRAAFEGTGQARALGIAAAGLVAAAVVLPALPTVLPGNPLFEGDLGAEGDRIALPAGTRGRVRLLVAGRLAEGGEPTASYRILGPREPVEGRLDRTASYARVGRSGRARVTREHNADWHDASIPAGTRELVLQRISGPVAGRLLVSGHRPPVSGAGTWALAAAALLCAAVAEARLGRRNAAGVPAGMALAFGLLVTLTATPVSAVGPALGAMLLGAIGGSIGGWVVGAAARRILPPQPRA
jgi:hypothetical protein